MSVRALAPRCPSSSLQWCPGSCIYVPRRASGPPQALPEECSSMARAPVSKTGGWGFESLHSCHRR
jgi:hypothetical protein